MEDKGWWKGQARQRLSRLTSENLMNGGPGKMEEGIVQSILTVESLGMVRQLGTLNSVAVYRHTV